MKTLGVLSMVFAVSFATMAQAACPVLDKSKLDALVAQEGPLHIVFFSSWCSSCKEHLQKSSGAKNTIFVAAFDTAERAEKTFVKLGTVGRCYFNEGLTEFFGIKVVPAEVTYKGL